MLCDLCQHRKVSSIVALPMHKITTTLPFELVTTDLVLLPHAQGNISCFVVLDHHGSVLLLSSLRLLLALPLFSRIECSRFCRIGK